MKWNHVGSIGQGGIRIRMHFHEKPVAAGSCRRACQGFDEFTLAAGFGAAPPGSCTLWVASKTTG